MPLDDGEVAPLMVAVTGQVTRDRSVSDRRGDGEVCAGYIVAWV